MDVAITQKLGIYGLKAKETVTRRIYVKALDERLYLCLGDNDNGKDMNFAVLHGHFAWLEVINKETSGFIPWFGSLIFEDPMEKK